MKVNRTSQAARQSDIHALLQLTENISQRLAARKKLNQVKVIGHVEYLEQKKSCSKRSAKWPNSEPSWKCLNRNMKALKSG